jgi:hypothetical protein
MTSPKSDTLSKILSALLKWLMSGIASLLSIMAFADDQLLASQALASYTDQNSWQGIQHYLPKEYHLDETQRPKEEWWSWQGHTVHLDTYRKSTGKSEGDSVSWCGNKWSTNVDDFGSSFGTTWL